MDRVFPYSWGVPADPSVDKPNLPDGAWVVATNLRALMDQAPELDSNPKLGTATKLGASAISRLLNGHNATIETLERVAKAFGLSAWQLMVPGMDPKNPPVLQPVSEREAALYRRFKETFREFIKEDAQ